VPSQRVGHDFVRSAAHTKALLCELVDDRADGHGTAVAPAQRDCSYRGDVGLERSHDCVEDGRAVLGATTTAPQRWTHATAAQQPDGAWMLTILPIDEPDLAIDATCAVLDDISTHGGGLVRWWTNPSAPSGSGLTDGRDETLAAAAGLTRARELLELAVPLPLADTTSISTRPFRLGLDDDALLRVNNAAFAWHPDQREWDHARLAAKVTSGDLVPSDVLLTEHDGVVVGFCWTKAHPHRDPAEGEIYVIAVAPESQGGGLGRALTIAGLQHLHAVHHTPVGMLYVESTNDAARALYARLGFTHRRTMRSYERML
jgi:ribosomal protein S18 acetylase RimI-like enzyme